MTSVGGAAAPAPVLVRSRPAAVVGWLLLLAGTVLAVAAILLLRDEGRIGLELPSAAAFLMVGAVERRAWVRLDADGIEIRDGLRHALLHWSVVRAVELDARHRLAAPVHLVLKDGDHVTPRACWGLSRRRCETLAAAVEPIAREHGVDIVRIEPGAES